MKDFHPWLKISNQNKKQAQTKLAFEKKSSNWYHGTLQINLDFGRESTIECSWRETCIETIQGNFGNFWNTFRNILVFSDETKSSTKELSHALKKSALVCYLLIGFFSLFANLMCVGGVWSFPQGKEYWHKVMWNRFGDRNRQVCGGIDYWNPSRKIPISQVTLLFLCLMMLYPLVMILYWVIYWVEVGWKHKKTLRWVINKFMMSQSNLRFK